MQSPEIILSNELFTVAVFLWVGTFSLLLWTFLRMHGLNKAIRIFGSTSGQEGGFPSLPNRIPVYIAVILETIGVIVLLAGLFVWIPIPLFPLSIIIWAGVFIMLFWQMMSLNIIEESLAVVSSYSSQE